MKKLILSELLLLFLATTFISDTPPGWFQQTLPVNKLVNDIFFLDSLTGWVVCSNENYPPNDTGYILKTTNGGNNWTIQLDSMFNYYAVQFLDINSGYAAGGTGRGKFLKTTNGGNSWIVTTPFGSGIYAILDISFINENTGWVCSDDSFGGGIFKTTNGGINWEQQAGSSYRPQKLFFINKDTGWAGSSDWKLYRTTNGGTNWGLQYTTTVPIGSIFFFNPLHGWIEGGTGNGCLYTTDGGSNWSSGQGNVAANYDVKFVTDSIGYSGGSLQKVAKSTDGGKNWGYQNIPIFTALQTSFFRNDTLLGWMGRNGIIKTTDGGGPITFTGIIQISNEIPSNYKLYQNYPNPFNGKTKIKYEIANSKEQIGNIKLVIYSVEGKEVITLVNANQLAAGGAGTYEADFSGESLSSGVYFYSLIVDGRVIDTKKMLIVK